VTIVSLSCVFVNSQLRLTMLQVKHLQAVPGNPIEKPAIKTAYSYGLMW